MKKIRPLSASVLKDIARATPPPKFPRGYFDPLFQPVRELLDKGLKIHQAADFLISRGGLKTNQRSCFLVAMRGRISRLTRKSITPAAVHEWKWSMFYESTHLIPAGANRAVCGAQTAAWASEVSDSNRCCRCLGLARRNGIVTI